MGDEIRERLGGTSSKGDVDERGRYADEDAMEDEMGSDTAADPNGEDKTGKQRGGWRRVGESVLAGKKRDWKDEGDYGNFSEESAEQDSDPVDSR